jgi:predicted nucleic acid-binding protein
MSFLLDTNVVSEWVKVRPDPSVVAWLAAVDEEQVFVSVVTLAELRYGIERMTTGSRRNRLAQWLRDDLALRFDGRVLSIDHIVANFWGKVVARSESAGRPIGAMDAFIAATAEAYSLTLVTRNASDFEASIKAIINPWANEDPRTQ